VIGVAWNGEARVVGGFVVGGIIFHGFVLQDLPVVGSTRDMPAVDPAP
jgi:hypothetical protein